MKKLLIVTLFFVKTAFGFIDPTTGFAALVAAAVGVSEAVRFCQENPTFYRPPDKAGRNELRDLLRVQAAGVKGEGFQLKQIVPELALQVGSGGVAVAPGVKAVFGANSMQQVFMDAELTKLIEAVIAERDWPSVKPSTGEKLMVGFLPAITTFVCMTMINPLLNGLFRMGGKPTTAKDYTNLSSMYVVAHWTSLLSRVYASLGTAEEDIDAAKDPLDYAKRRAAGYALYMSGAVGGAAAVNLMVKKLLDKKPSMTVNNVFVGEEAMAAGLRAREERGDLPQGTGLQEVD